MGNVAWLKVSPVLRMAFLHMMLLFIELLEEVFYINKYLTKYVYVSF